VRHVPVSCEQREAMLARIGVSDADTLFSDIPVEARLGRPLALPAGMTEQELVTHMEGLAARDRHVGDLVSFLGGGCYDHYVPAVVEHVVRKPEFFTAYTPYQPEVAQGTLQAAYEFQTTVCELTGMDVANASMYDGATALAEAALLAARATGRRRVVVADTVHPEWRAVLRTYSSAGLLDVATAPSRDGVLDRAALGGLLEGAAALLVADPSFLGTLDDLSSLGEAAHEAGALFVVATDPALLGVLEPPSIAGADVVVAEGQPLGSAVSYGGPGVGLFACREEHLRRMPGRIVGRTVDVDGRPAFVLTMQTREQHIRREKATSNICSNHALNALAFTVHAAALGAEGLAAVGRACVSKARYLHDALVGTGRFAEGFGAPFAREFALRWEGDVSSMQAAMLERGILAGLDLGVFEASWSGLVLFAVTERNSRADMDRFVAEVVSL